MPNNQESFAYIQERIDSGDFNSHEETIAALVEYHYQGAEIPPLGAMIVAYLPFDVYSASQGQAFPFDSFTSKWAPADGRSVAGSIYAFINSDTDAVPNLRAPFVTRLLRRPTDIQFYHYLRIN